MGRSIITTPSSPSAAKFQPKQLILVIFVILLQACRPGSALVHTPTGTAPARDTATATVTERATDTPTASITPSVTPTEKPTQTATITPTLAPLEMFRTKLRPGVEPQGYLDDTCDFLRMRWSREGSWPGTVVVPVMFHSIAQDGTVLEDPKDITAGQFLAFVKYARSLGFEAISMRELLGFLKENARIPERSMVLIIDDRRPGTIREWFMPVLEEADWTMTAAYIADPNSLTFAWRLMDELHATGRVEVQSHGYTGQLYIVKDTPVEQIQDEIWKSTEVLEERFGVRPMAFIWPGGNFTQQSVEIAREGGYELGFTAFSRGPILFNWVPLGEQERLVGDPLMVLPRAWSSAVNVNLDEAVRIGEEAAAYAERNFAEEAQWYRTYCGGEVEKGG